MITRLGITYVSMKCKTFRRRQLSNVNLSIHSLNQEVFMAEINTTVRIINRKGLAVYILLSRYTLNLEGSKISHLPNDHVYQTYFHSECLRGNILIKIQLILACKVHILICFFFRGVIPH